MNRNYKALELDKILHMLCEQSVCADTKQAAQELEPAHGLFEVNTLISETQDAFKLIGQFGTPSFGGIKNPCNALRRAQAGGGLSMLELLRVAQVLRTVRLLKQWRQKSAGVASVLDVYFNTLTPNKNLEENITRSILSEDEIADNASPTLSSIRKKIKNTSAKAREVLDKMIRSSTYQKYLQDAIITIRDGRYVVPVKSEFRAEVPGLVHDTSASGATVFVEPMAAVEANNEIKVLLSKEQNEIEKILLELSMQAGIYADDIITSYERVIDLDLIFAKANLAYNMKASVPVMNNEGHIRLDKARHPLINKDIVVPTSIELGINFDSLVITGPNTGGKTVSLKTLGLLTLMAMCGLMIPAADESKLSVFEHILVDIGDEQSIEQSLSTFSAHMTNIVSILEQANNNSLVLIDELGAGTDPIEGAALAIAILEQLHTQGAIIASTTHYAELKEYALKKERVENGCCEFDVSTLRPTYKLLIGVPGRSNAFAISQRLGMKKDLVDKARGLISSESRRFEDVVQSLEAKRQYLEQQLKDAHESTKKAEQSYAHSRKELEDLKKQAKLEIEKAHSEAQKITDNTRSQAYALMDEMERIRKKAELSSEDKAKLRSGIKSMEKESDPVIKNNNDNYTLPRPLKAGDSVLIYDIDKKAVVLKPSNSSNEVLVKAGIIQTRVKLSNLRLINDEKQKTKIQRSATRNVKKTDIKAVTDIDLRGQTALEAIMELDRAIDSALLSGINQITIIHGKGTGVLRKEVQEHLRHNSSIKTYRLGVFGEGGDGVTIAELK